MFINRKGTGIVGFIPKRQMVRELQQALQQAGYECTQADISAVYPGQLGSRKLYGLWRRRKKAIHWVAQTLKQRRIRFSKEPTFEQRMLLFAEPSPRPHWPRGGGDFQLPIGDRD